MKRRLRTVLAFCMVLASCTSVSEPSTSVSTSVPVPPTTLGIEDCVASQPDAVPDEVREGLGGDRPILGGGDIWTIAPDNTPEWFLMVPEEQNPFLAHLKLPWWRLSEGELAILLISPGGEDAGSVELEQESYDPTGFVPSTLSFDEPGCWTVSATYESDEVEFQMWVPEG